MPMVRRSATADTAIVARSIRRHLLDEVRLRVWVRLLIIWRHQIRSAAAASITTGFTGAPQTLARGRRRLCCCLPGAYLELFSKVCSIVTRLIIWRPRQDLNLRPPD